MVLVTLPQGSIDVRAGSTPPTDVKISGRAVTLPARVPLPNEPVLIEARHPDFPPIRHWLAPARGAAPVVLSMCEWGLEAHVSGKCCPVGQHVAASGRCEGTATCGGAFSSDGLGGCRLNECGAGEVRQRAGACCPAGQRFEPRAALCIGTPLSCPVGTLRGFDGCVSSRRFLDADKDRVSDQRDRCPDRKEDLDGYEDDDGCPDDDDDADRVPDARDLCPRQAEDPDGFEDDDGCPDPDDDYDGISDHADRCPRDAEDPDGVEDDDGCPEAAAPDAGTEPGR